MQKTDFMFRAFLRAKNTNALELRTLMRVVQTKQWRECKATDAEKLLSQWEKVAKCNFKSKLKYMKMFLSHEMKCYLHAEDRFWCV